ncbi:MAG: F0F1 ATP synthase subunit gamma [Chloroflexi bacterium HGW-Chloroflexi-2]|jgi:F-type H+-transporting ATPase subunit gamma|nr:MAG: F0F1 ATP synthase subunit gamma [Chloroflexi bacterium HGW-Chloroflexi-2]
MYTLEDIQKRINNIQDLHSIVRTMKVLASISIRQYEKAVESLVDYARTTEMALQVTLRNRAALVEAKTKQVERLFGVIVIGSDQGMCGQFNEQIASYTLKRLDNMGIPQQRRSVFALGSRVVSRLESMGQPVDHFLPVPSSVEGIRPTVQDLLWQIDRWREEENRDTMYIFHNRLISSSQSRPRTTRFWPIDPDDFRFLEKKAWPTNNVPTYSMPWQDLFSAILRQYLYVALSRSLAESLASENTNRLLSMQVAERNIEEKIAEFTNIYHQQRQNSITSELLDVVSGFEILMKDDQK